jgi:hypothetical protein
MKKREKMFKLEEFDIKKFDSILDRGLCNGIGKQGSQVCIEAAICETLGLEHSDDPLCVASAVRAFKIKLNDFSWSSPESRARGLRDLGIAQLGSLGVIDNIEFISLITKKTIQILIPKLYREIFPDNQECLEVALECEIKGTNAAAYAAAYAAANAAAYAAANAAVNAAADAAANAAYAAANAADSDKYLILASNLCLEVLKELKSPGVALL